MNIIDISEEEWKKNFAEISAISHEEAISLIKETGIIEGKKIPLLKLNNLTLERPIVLRNCQIEGISAKGTIFNKEVAFIHCWFTREIEMSAWKEREQFQPTVFTEDLILRHCRLEDTFNLRNGDIRGEITLEGCQIKGGFCCDKSAFKKSVSLKEPGEFLSLSAYRAVFSENLNIEGCTILGSDGRAVDLNGAKIEGTLSLVDSSLKQELQLKKARIGENSIKAWTVSGGSLSGVDLEEAHFYSDVSLKDVECTGIFSAQLPKGEHGEKKGRSTNFNGDSSFEKVKFLEVCNFYGARFQKYANFKECQFQKGGMFNQVDFAAYTSFWQSESQDSLHFRKAHFGGQANFGNVTFGAKSSFNGATFSDLAAFFDSQTQGDIFFSEAHFEGDLKMRKMHCQGGLILQKIIVDGALSLSSAVVDDRLILKESILNGSLEAPRVSIGTWATLDGIVVKGEVELPCLEVGAKLKAEPTPMPPKVEPTQTSKEEICEEKMQNDQEPPEEEEKKQEFVPGTLYLSKGTFRQPIDLTSAKIKGNLDMESTNCYAEIEATKLNIGGNFMLSKTYLRGIARFSNSKMVELVSFKARYKEEVSFNSIQCDKILLRGSSFDRGVTVRGANIASQINFNNVDVDGKIDLFDSKFGRIFFDNLLVDNFLIRREMIGDRLPSECLGNNQQAKNEYGILKQAFQIQNRYQDMDWAYYRFCRSNRKAKKISWRHPIKSIGVFLDWLLLDVGFGYGTYPMNIALVAFLVIFFFGILFYSCPGGIIDGKSNPMTHLNFKDAIYMSVITFASMDYGDCMPYFRHWLKYAFSLEGLLGIFLTTLFVATVSRKIIRT